MNIKQLKFEGKGFFTTFEDDKLLNEYGAEGWRIISSFAEQMGGNTVSVYYTLIKENKSTN
jgi:hypothetical protein